MIKSISDEMTVIIRPEATPAQQAFSGVWMALLVFAWDVGLAALVSLPGARRALREKLPLIEGAAGAALIALAVSLAFIE